MPKAIFFDLWNTLIYSPTKDRVEEMRLFLGVDKNKSEFYGVFIEDARNKLMLDRNFDEEKFFAGILKKLNLEPDKKRVNALTKIWLSRLDGIRPFPETFDVLGKLKKKYKLGVISNTDRSGSNYSVSNYELSEYMDAMIFSCDVGLLKPNPEIFELAARRMGVSCNDSVMVGDNLDVDIRGAERAGMRGIWLDRAGAGDAEKSIKNLSELENLLFEVENG